MFLAHLLLVGTALRTQIEAPEVGTKAPSFEAKTLDGKDVKFAGAYKGKVVLLDFWATWCQPCLMDMPNIVAAYDKHHEKGFEILSVSLDEKESVAKVAPVTKQQKMGWPQICDKGGWDSPIAKAYGVNTLPRAFVIDGDTGEVLATRLSLHREGKWTGPGLTQFIEDALAKKKSAKGLR